MDVVRFSLRKMRIIFVLSILIFVFELRFCINVFSGVQKNNRKKWKDGYAPA